MRNRITALLNRSYLIDGDSLKTLNDHLIQHATKHLACLTTHITHFLPCNFSQLLCNATALSICSERDWTKKERKKVQKKKTTTEMATTK